MSPEVTAILQKNQNIITQMQENFEEVHHIPPTILADLYGPFMAWVSADKSLLHNWGIHAEEIYVQYIFVTPLKDFDSSGWVDKNGLSFPERAAFLVSGEFRKGLWRQMTYAEICLMMTDDIRPFHPSFNLKHALKMKG